MTKKKPSQIFEDEHSALHKAFHEVAMQDEAIASSELSHGIESATWDLPEGRTHYQNDGCGELAHNSVNAIIIREVIKKE